MNAIKEAFINRIIDARIRNLDSLSDLNHWAGEVMMSGWVGYDKFTDEELIAGDRV